MTELADLYQEVLLDHSRHPRNRRELPAPAAVAEGDNPLCGDAVTVYVAFDGERIADAAFMGRGCAISQASASLMTEAVTGKDTAEARQLAERFRRLVTTESGGDGEDLGKLAIFRGVRDYPMRVKCATLAWHTLLSAIEAAKEKEPS
jgi:nitrogen fixation NifU-like protein